MLGRDGFDQRGRTFGTQLRELAAILGGTGAGPITGDHAVADPGLRPIPLTAAAGSATGARRAAAAGVGLVFDSLTAAPELARLTQIHAEAGGHGPHVLGRRVWVGEPPAGLFESQLASYRRQAGTGSYLESATASALVHGEPGQITEQILAAARAARASALALRISLPGLSAAATSDQLRRLGQEVLPLLRPAFAALQDTWLDE